MLGANTMWGLMSPLSKLLMASGAVTSLVVTDLRIGGAMVLFWIASFFQKPEHVNHKDLITLFFASLFAIVFNQGCFIFGVSLSSPADASIITTSMPLRAMLLAAFILKEPITGKKVLGIACGAGGALLLILRRPEPAGRFVCQPYGNMGRFASLVRTVLLCVLHCTLQGFCQQIFAHHHHEVDVYLLFHLHDSLLCQRFDERRLERTEGGGNWQSDLYRGRCYLRQLHADCSGTKEPPPHGSRYVQLYPAACGLYRSRMLGMDFFNTTKIIAVVLIFGGVYLVTSSRSRKEMEAYKQTERE